MLELRVKSGVGNHSWCMGVDRHSYGGLGGINDGVCGW